MTLDELESKYDSIILLLEGDLDVLRHEPNRLNDLECMSNMR